MSDIQNIKKIAHAQCPCMSNLLYSECCQVYHTKQSKAATAEKLMRSRYAAYHHALVDYLIDTTHPDQIKPKYRIQLESTKHDTIWKGLEILSTSMGSASDKIGKVRFIAHYHMNGEDGSMEEHSRFRRYKGDWVYYDDKG